MMKRLVRKGFTLHLPKGVVVSGPKVMNLNPKDVVGQEHKLDYIPGTAPKIEQPVGGPTVGAVEEAENRKSGPMTRTTRKKAIRKSAKKAAKKKKRGQRGRSRIRKD